MGKRRVEAQCPAHSGTTYWLLAVFGGGRAWGEHEYGCDSRDWVGLFC